MESDQKDMSKLLFDVLIEVTNDSRCVAEDLTARLRYCILDPVQETGAVQCGNRFCVKYRLRTNLDAHGLLQYLEAMLGKVFVAINLVPEVDIPFGKQTCTNL